MIEFKEGFNLILGETADNNDKTNGVGKSLAVEFLNYALLKKRDKSRVALIPDSEIPPGATVCVDLEIGHDKITIERSIRDNIAPSLTINGTTKEYSSLQDACDHMSELLFRNASHLHPPSFRSMLGPLIRDEGSEFKSIVNCYNTDIKVPTDYAPHLYLLHIDPLPYVHAKELYKQIREIATARKKIEENIEAITGKNVSESKSDLNELESQVSKIEADIESLENIQGYETVKSEIIQIETELENERNLQSVLKSELANIEMFSGDNYIDGSEVAELYNQFKEGLGDLIRRELDQVTAFKKKIDDFQLTIIDGRRADLDRDLAAIHDTIFQLNRRYREKVKLLDQDGLLVSLKQTIAIHRQKFEEHSSLSAFVKKYSEYVLERKRKKLERDEKVFLLESFKNDAAETIDSFERSILDIHNYVYGNRRSSFEIDVSKNVEVVKFELRADSDGSHSINREIVFLYDIALLLSEKTGTRHPGLLVHDNIFDVDQATLVNSLNFVYSKSQSLRSKQYILTLNNDKLSEEDRLNLHFDVSDFSRASLTRKKGFLSFRYQELSKIKRQGK